MNQKQNQGGKSQEQNLPGKGHEKKEPENAAGNKKTTPQPEKPAVTDDSGNPVDKKLSDAGKGYSEKKPTEPWSDTTPSSDKNQQKDSEKSAEDTNPAKKIHGHKEIPQQLNQEEKENYEKRVRQSGKVEG